VNKTGQDKKVQNLSTQNNLNRKVFCRASSEKSGGLAKGLFLVNKV
jgi:hypothetical protein